MVIVVFKFDRSHHSIRHCTTASNAGIFLCVSFLYFFISGDADWPGPAQHERYCGKIILVDSYSLVNAPLLKVGMLLRSNFYKCRC